AHLGDVEAGDFDFRRDTVAADDLADHEEDHACGNDVPGDADTDADELGDELRHAAAVEQAGHAAADDVVAVAVAAVGEEAQGDDAPCAVDAVNADGAD